MASAWAIADKHVSWMVKHGFTPRDVCISVGTWAPAHATETDARLAVVAAWVEIAKKADRRAAL